MKHLLITGYKNSQDMLYIIKNLVFSGQSFWVKIYISCLSFCMQHQAAIIGPYTDRGWGGSLVIGCSLHEACPQRAQPWSPANVPSACASQSTHDHSSGLSHKPLLQDAHQLSAGYMTPGGNWYEYVPNVRMWIWKSGTNLMSCQFIARMSIKLYYFNDYWYLLTLQLFILTRVISNNFKLCP